MYLGAVADDVTGGTDLASVLRRAGLNVVQTLDIPATVPEADAVVVSLKIRTAPADVATSQATAAGDALVAGGAEQIFFKYCSTFDSTDEGNIGPVIDVLMQRLQAGFSIACPAYPDLGRTVYAGHLFVGNQLLSESSMRHHPLTPMTDSNLVRVLGRQTPSRVGLVDLATVEAGAAAIASRYLDLSGGGYRMAIVDALLERHLDAIAHASTGLRLVTGGAALGGAIARMNRARLGSRALESPPPIHGPVAMLSGSCSAMTLSQIEYASALMPTREINPLEAAADPSELPRLIDWASEQIKRGGVLLYSSGRPDDVRGAQERLGRAAAASLVESLFGSIATALAGCGVRTFVVAGGETSGAVLQALRIRMLTFGEELDPGVPWTSSLDPAGFVFALKSGNFGTREFFVKALERVR
jgi:uncharacterized protein YgbK (DUF1537 family)